MSSIVNNLISNHDFLDIVIENISFTKNNWIILPNKRSGIALNKKIGLKKVAKIKQPHKIKIGVFNSFLEEISGYKIIDNLELIHLLYNISPFKLQQQPFECFYPWGISLLKDFDLVDKSLLEVKTVFSNVSQYKNLEYDFLTDKQKLLIKEFWNKFTDEKDFVGSKCDTSDSDNKKLFLKNCYLIPQLYENFRNQLSITKKAYTGFVFKQICSEITNTNSFNNEKIKGYNLIFAGFSKLYKAEIKLLKFLQENYGAKILWDTIPNKNIKIFSNFTENIEPERPPTNSPLIYETSSGSDEITFVINKILKVCKDPLEKYDFDKLGDSAIIIPNERIMRNVINQCEKKGIPYNVKGTNIRYSKPFIILEETIRKQILDIRNDPTQKKSIIDTLKKAINNLKTSTSENEENASFIETAENSLNKLNKIFCDKPLYASKEFLYLFKKTIINDSLKLSKNIQANIPSINEINKNSVLFDTIPVDFKNNSKYGQYNKGISILEIQDTRALDFDNIFIISANETDLPPKQHNTSFIPYTLKKAYGIPIDKEFDNKYYAYLFYRLLYRSKSMIITYRSQDSINGLLEPSRYVLQLIYGGSMPCKINKIGTNVAESLNINKAIIIDKNKDVMEEIYTSNILNKGLSASAVNTYLDCGLKFYLQYIKRTKPLEDIPSEEKILGNIVHKVLEKIYKRDGIQSNSSLDTTHKIHHIVNKVIEESLIGNSLYKDIYFNITGKIVNKIIEIDHKNVNYKVLDVEVGKNAPFSAFLELEYSTQVNFVDSSISSSTLDKKNNIEITKETQSQKISIYGVVDRIDIPSSEINNHNNQIRLIDYKTGYYDPKIRDIESLFDREIERNKTAFQLLFYCLILQKKDPYNKKSICPSVYGVREIFSPKFDPRLRIKQNATYVPIEDISLYLPEFERYLKNTLEGIIDPDIPFSQTTVSKKCMHCAYKNICSS